MEWIKSILKKSGWMAIAESLFFAIIGIILICRPEEIMSIIAYLIGAVFAIIGVAKTINYFQQKGNNDLYNYELVYGIMAIIVGIIVIVYRDAISKIFGIVIGMWIIYSSIMRVSSSLKLRAIKSNIWKYSLVLAIIMFICGLYIILNTGIIVKTIGIIMVIYSIIDIIENCIFINNIKKL